VQAVEVVEQTVAVLLAQVVQVEVAMVESVLGPQSLEQPIQAVAVEAQIVGTVLLAALA